VKELLEGRRFGFAPRPLLASVALGLGLALSLLDLMAWGGWGARNTNGFVVAAYWLCFGVIVVGLLGLLASLIEMTDVPDEDRGLARLDVAGVVVALVVYGASAALRAFDLGAAAAGPPAFLLALAGLLVLAVGAGLTSLLYAAREWEELEELVPEHRRRRHAASR